MKFIFLNLLIVIFAFSACSSKSNSARKPVTNIQITPSNKVISSGNEFTISVDSRIKKPKVIEIQLFFNNKLITTSTEDNFNITINSADYIPGKYSIKTIAKNKEGKTGTNYVNVSIVSEITPEKLSYKVIESYPHNIKNFTEGFEFYKGKLFESTGNNNESFIYSYNHKNGKIFLSSKLDKQYFGEGITILNNKLYQLTYKAQKCFVYDVNTLEKINEFNYKSAEGWGLTNNGKSLIMSNGTSQIIYVNPDNFETEKIINVSYPDGFINNINELEYVDGIIYANIWTYQTIVKLNAETGKVLALINMNGLLNNFKIEHQIDVLNGIAYHPEEEMFYVTGKYWPRTFKVKFE